MNPDQTLSVLVPAGAPEADEWRDSPNDHATYRYFRSNTCPAFGPIAVVAGGVQVVYKSCPETVVVRTVDISIKPGLDFMLRRMSQNAALILARVLSQAVHDVSELAASDPQNPDEMDSLTG